MVLLLPMESFPEDRGVLRVDLLRNGPISEFSSFLTNLENAFNHLFALEVIVTEAKHEADANYGKKVRSLRSISKPEEIVFDLERLYLFRIRLTSPGWVDVFGKLNPLESLRQYLNDRHERKKDAAYRSKAEEDRLRLENEQLLYEIERIKTDVMKGKVQLLRDLGVSEHKIRQAITQHFLRPVEPLTQAQDAGFVGGARMLLFEELEDRD